MKNKYIIEVDDSNVLTNRLDNKQSIIITIPSAPPKIIECELTPIIDKIEENTLTKKWRADKGNSYWYINRCGEVDWNYELETDFDDWHYEMGNYFKSKKKADFYKEQLLVQNELRKYAIPDNEQAWNSNESIYSLGWDYANNSFMYDINWTIKKDLFYFKSEEDAKRAVVAAGGEDKVKKYYLNVKD